MQNTDRPRTSRLLFTKEELTPDAISQEISNLQKKQSGRKPAQVKSKPAPGMASADGKAESGLLSDDEPFVKEHVPLRESGEKEGQKFSKARKEYFKSNPEAKEHMNRVSRSDPAHRSYEQVPSRKIQADDGKLTREPRPSPGKGASPQAKEAAKTFSGKGKKAPAAGEVLQDTAAQTVPKLRFDEKAKKPPSKLKHPSTVTRAINTELHRTAAKANQDENVAAEASLNAEKGVETALREGDHAFHAHKLRTHRKEEKRLDNANIKAIEKARESENPTFTSNPYSRWQQKRAIRKEYAKAKKAGKSTSTAHTTSQKAKSVASEVKDRVKQVVNTVRRKPKLLLLGLLGGMLVMVMSMVQSCTPLAQSVLESIVIGTYPATEDDVRAAERAYLAKEQDLKYEMDHYKDVHPGYDEYHVEQDEIWHNPYVLIAIISAYYDGEEWDMDKAMPVIEKYFKLQYRVTEDVTTETRYRTETQSGTRWVTDPDTGQQTLESYTYEEDVPYEYTICNVTLENYDLSHTPVISMSHHTMGMYALYMATHGNMEGIFHGKYAVPLKDPYIYDIPQETLDADPIFARLMEEANKYVGYPYVWGGASPETSFDCSGFVSYVYTASGVYNTGRLGARGLHSLCRMVSEDEVKPGDLVFFAGTMGDKVDGITHVGIYVGNHHMIHCGSPCGYADLNDSYWVQHFHSYGRVPY